jgi:hypothetical protein
MAWDTGDASSEALAETPGAGDGDETAEINPTAGESIEVLVFRTDAVTNGDDWRIEAHASPDSANAGWATDPAPRTFRMLSTQLRKDFILPNRYGWRIYIENDDSDQDVVAATVYWRGTGVQL